MGWEGLPLRRRSAEAAARKVCGSRAATGAASARNSPKGTRLASARSFFDAAAAAFARAPPRAASSDA